MFLVPKSTVCFLVCSDVLAAYASFLWETEEDEEEDLGLRENDHVAVPHGTGTTANA